MAMFLVTSSKSKRLLYLNFVGTVRPEEFQSGHGDVATELAGLSPGFRYLVDLSDLDFMGLDCMTELGRLMELIGQAGAGLVVRVIPDPSKDIGMNILTVFHYPQQLQVVTCNNLAEAVKALGL
jgi:anti-anti-sigma regulatory factor